MISQTYLASLNTALIETMQESNRVVLIGEDLCDPYGGAFKVTRGLSSRFNGRVLNTPISEAAITGIGMGLALRGFLPVIEIMFGDFLALCADQLLNGASKFPLMYKGKVNVPLVVRTPMGGGAGYGPTHSQSIEKMFLGMPGLMVVSPSIFHDPGKILKRVILSEAGPALFVEHKMLYSRALARDAGQYSVDYVSDESDFPVAVVRNYSEGKPDAIVIGYGVMGLHIESLMKELKLEEIRLMAFVPSKISSHLPDEVIRLIPQADVVVVAEESTEQFNWGSEICSDIYSKSLGKLARPIIRMGSKCAAIPAARDLEQEMLLNKDKIKEAIFKGLV